MSAVSHNHFNKLSQCSSSCEAHAAKPENKPFFQNVRLFSGQVKSTLSLWVARAHQRKHLAKLDDRMLKDIGLTRFDANKEIAKPFWR